LTLRALTDTAEIGEFWSVSGQFIMGSLALNFIHQKRYDELGYAVRGYRHILMAKWAGRGHDPDGIVATKFGGLALDCPACPQPGINLPPDWESAPPEFQ
jgi:hypothetical protein